LPTKTVPSRGGRIDSDARNLRKQKTAKTKTRASNASSGVSAPPPAKRARVTVEDIQDEDDIMSPPSNSSNIDAIGQDSTSSTSRPATARRSNAKVCTVCYPTNNIFIFSFATERTNEPDISIL
jgi:hypothetical protein